MVDRVGSVPASAGTARDAGAPRAGAETIDATLARLSTTRAGLTGEEAARRLARDGPNELAEKRLGLARRLLPFFWGPIPLMIEAAALLSGLVGHWADLGVIVAMLLVNAAVGFWQESRADTAIAALRSRLALVATVLRDGRWQALPARQLVAGDVVLLKLGQIVPADVRLLEGDDLSVDQAVLTGESLPVEKAVGDEAYSGSTVRRGEMKGVVEATGMATYFGRTAALVESAGTTSHFQRAVLRIGDFLVLCTLGLVAVVVLVALFRSDPLVDTLLFALILTVAAIPVALPAVLSVTMAVGAERLARMKAVVSRLASVEELAGMSVLCSDKTGTLTENRLAVGEPIRVDAEDAAGVLVAAALSSDRESPDAIDAAIQRAVPPEALARTTVIRVHPFDPATKRTEAEVEEGGARFRVTKGAPQTILDVVAAGDDLRRRVLARVDALAEGGFRAVAVARSGPEGRWRLEGLLPFTDPPREDSARTLEAAGRMGVRVKMITGDHLAIARQLAARLGLRGEIQRPGPSPWTPAQIDAAGGFAEVLPEHKFEIVRTLQARGWIVGMTGDGVNDAPALKQADVGIAVSGATDAARGAADLVLTAPGLSVVVGAIEEARRIFQRMTAYATYRISETIRVLLFMALSIVVFGFYPVTPVMIVLLALLNDLPIMAIAYDNATVAPSPVRWEMRKVLGLAAVLGFLGVVSTFLLFYFADVHLGLPRARIQTLLFLKLLVAGHLTLYLTRSRGPFWRRPWPSWKLVAATETTQLIGTLAAVYGWMVEPLGWGIALGTWAYSLAWFALNGAAAVAALRLLGGLGQAQRRHLRRVEGLLHDARAAGGAPVARPAGREPRPSAR